MTISEPDQVERTRGKRKVRATHPTRHGPSTTALASVAAIAAIVGMVVAIGSDAAPTTTVWLDALERFGGAAILVVAASRARRWTLVTAAALAGIAAEGLWAAPALCALVLAAALAGTKHRNRVLGAAIGAGITVSLFHLEVSGPNGLESAIAFAGAVPILVSGYRMTSQPVRGLIKKSAAILGIAIVAVTVLTGVSMAIAAGPAQDGATELRQAVELAQNGEGAAAASSFALARDDLDDAASKAGHPWTWAARAVPVLGVNVAAVHRTFGSAGEMADAARDLSANVDFADAVRADGGLDPEVISGFAEPLSTAAAILDRADDLLADLDSPWLVPQLRDRLDALTEEVGDLSSSTDSATAAVLHGLPLLGTGGPRRYLFLFGNPAELRDIGGHIGHWAEAEVDNGRIELIAVGSPLDLSGPRGGAETLRGEHPPSLLAMQPVRYPQNWGAHPDFPSVAQISSQLYEARTGHAVDGVVYADPAAMAALLSITGPITVPGLEPAFELTSENAVEFLTKSQYALFAEEDAGSAALEEVIRTVFDRLSEVQLPGPASIVERFGPLVSSGRFLIESTHEPDEAILERFGLRGRMSRPEGADLLAVVNRNAGPSKLDTYLRRDVGVDTDWDPRTGAVDSWVTVELTNEAPASGLPAVVAGHTPGVPAGTNITDLSVFTALEADEFFLEGEHAAGNSLLEGNTWRHTIRLVIPPGQSRTVEFHLIGQFADDGSYQLIIDGQPLLLGGTTTVNVESMAGEIRSGPSVGAEGSAAVVELDTDQDFRMTLTDATV